jgi:hypothetical protein
MSVSGWTSTRSISGPAPEQQNCPSRAVGRGNTVWIGPTGADEQTATGRKGWSSPGARGTIRRNDQDKRSDVALQGRGVSVRTGWGPQGSAAVDAIVADMEISADPVPVPSRAPAQRRTTVPTPRQEPVPVGPKTAEERVAPASLSSLTAGRSGGGSHCMARWPSTPAARRPSRACRRGANRRMSPWASTPADRCGPAPSRAGRRGSTR